MHLLVDRASETQVRLVILCLCALVLLLGMGVVVADEAADPTVGKSKILHELEDAEILMFRGDYDEAYRRCEHARDAVKREGGMNKALLDALVDMIQAEIRLPQGFFSVARSKLERADKTLRAKAAWWAQRGANVNDLRAFNFRWGYAQLLRGDVALTEAKVDALTGKVVDEGNALKKCKPHYKNGIDIIRDTWNKADANDIRVQIRLMHKADLREVVLMALEGDFFRAESVFDEVERFITTQDLMWIRQFHPDAEAGAALAAAAAAAGKDGATAPETPAGEAIAPVALAPAEMEMKASLKKREAVRVALLYLELLSVKARLNLASGKLPIAEEAAMLARDIAEERFPSGVAYRNASLELAEVYFKCHDHEVDESRRNRGAVFEYGGQTVNVHRKAADSYLADAEELVRETEKAIQGENAAQPIHLLAADLRRRIAEVKKDPRGIQDAERDLRRLADARKLDKPKVDR